MFPGILPPKPPTLAHLELQPRQQRPAKTERRPVFEVQNDPSTPAQRRPSTYVPTSVGSSDYYPHQNQRVQWPSTLDKSRQASTVTRNDSIFPGHLVPREKQDSVARRKSVAVFLKTRSWSLFLDPPPTDIEGRFQSPPPTRPPVRNWAWRSRHDVMLRCVLGVAFALAIALVIFGVVYYVTHKRALAHDKETFICGYDRRGPECPTKLVGESEALEKADYINDGMIMHWLEIHCQWRRPSWKCGPMIGEEDTGVFPDGTYLQPLTVEDA